jgi:hypothetical protein
LREFGLQGLQVCSQVIDAPFAMTSAIIAHTDVNSSRIHFFFACNQDVIPLSELCVSNFFVD